MFTSSACAEFVGGEVGQSCGPGERRVVDQDVDPAEALEGATRQRFGNPRHGDVAGDAECAVAERIGRGGGPRLVTNVHDDRGAALVQARGNRPPETAGRARHDRHTPLEIALAEGHRG